MKKRCIVCGSELNLIVNEYTCGLCGYSEDLSGNRLRDAFSRKSSSLAAGPLFGTCTVFGLASSPHIIVSDLRRPQLTDPHIVTDPVLLTEMLEKELGLLMMESCSHGEAGEQPENGKKQGPTRASVPTLLSSSGAVGCSPETKRKLCEFYDEEKLVCKKDGSAWCAFPYADFCLNWIKGLGGA